MDNVPLLWPLFTFIFDWIFSILAGNKDNHESLDEFEFQVEPSSDSGVSFTWAS